MSWVIQDMIFRRPIRISIEPNRRSKMSQMRWRLNRRLCGNVTRVGRGYSTTLVEMSKALSYKLRMIQRNPKMML